jgi:hypothetical protein
VGAAPDATVVVVGGDFIVGHALALLLRGSGYDARFEALRTFDARQALLESGLVLLAPGLDEWGRDAVLSSIVAACHGDDLPVIELVSATVSRSGEGHALIPWPCRPEDLEREIEAALLRGKDCAGLSATAREEHRT